MDRERGSADAVALDRSTFVGGSDVGAILGVSRWKTPFDVWLEKTGRAPRAAPTDAQKKRFARGHRLEPMVIEMLIERLTDEGHTVELLQRNARYEDAAFSFMRAEIDAELRLDGMHVNVDAKTVSPYLSKEWGSEWSDEIPLAYAAQFLYGLGITGRDRCLAAALIGMDDLAIYDVRRDATTIEAIRARVAQFWTECVLADVAPDPIDFDDCYARFQQSDGGRIEASGDIRDAVFELADVKQKLKRLAEREDALKFRIADFMRPNAYLTADGHDIATWKEQSDTRFDTKAFAAAHPKLFARYQRTKPIRVLRLKVGA